MNYNKCASWLCSVTAVTLIVGAVFPGIAAADDPDAVPAALLNTHCSADQILAATKKVDPAFYDTVINKYNSEPSWLQQTIIEKMNYVLEQGPDTRQAEVDEFSSVFPEYAVLFKFEEPKASKIAKLCSSYPAEDRSVWNTAVDLTQIAIDDIAGTPAGQ